MNNVKDYAMQAEFSLAAYANWNAEMSESAYTLSIMDSGRGMSASQAMHFVDTYRVVAQYNDTLAEGGSNSGLSVTVFEDKVTGEKFLAIRGTNDLQDILSDIVDIALLQVKGVSFAFFLEQPCHVDHALNLPGCRNTSCSAASIGNHVSSPRRITTSFTGWRKRPWIGTVRYMPMH